MSVSLTDALTPLVAEAAAWVKQLQQSVVLVHDGRGHGSGVVWESDGLVVTSNHVVEHDQAQVELVRVGTRHGVQVPRQLVLVAKQFLYIERYARAMAPGWSVLTDPAVLQLLASA